MTSKQRAYLRGLANKIDSIFQVGKNGISDNLIVQVNDALEARELIKLNVLETMMTYGVVAVKIITYWKLIKNIHWKIL